VAFETKSLLTYFLLI